MGFGVRFREHLDYGSEQEFNALIKFLKQFLLLEHNEDGSHIIAAGTTLDQTHPYVTVGNVSGLTAERALVGTTNEIDVTDNGANSTVAVGLPAAVTITTSLSVPSATVSGLTSGRVPIISTGGLLADDADLTFLTDTLTATKVSTTDITATAVSTGAAAGAATGLRAITKKITGIADNVLTDVLTITVPNGNHAGSLRLLMLSSNGSTDAFESSRSANGLVVFQRNTGANAVATAATIADGIIATNAAGGSATHTLAYSVSAVSGGVGATNTFTIQITIDDSGNLGSNQLVLFSELLNAESSGISIA